MADGGSFITLAKENRSKAVTQVYTHTYIHNAYIHTDITTVSQSFNPHRTYFNIGMQDLKRILTRIHRRFVPYSIPIIPTHTIYITAYIHTYIHIYIYIQT